LNVPIALAAGAGAEWKNGLAWVIGGLISSIPYADYCSGNL
jgi:multidrug efflux pump subunit AcrB